MERSSLLRRAVVVPTVAALALVGLAATSTPASAAPIGSLTLNALDGTFNSQTDTWSATTSGACPDPATNFQVELSGPDIPAYPGNIVTGNAAGSTVGGVGSGPFTAPASVSLSDFATARAINVVGGVGYLSAGTYTVSVRCRTALQQASLGEYTGQFTVSGSGASSVVAAIAPAAETDTELTVSPSGTVGWGSTVTLTAQVTNEANGGPTPVGTVLFKDDGAAIGSAVAVDASGVASTTVATLALGDNSITAEFTGGEGFNDSATVTAATVSVELSGPSVLLPATLSGSVKVGATVTCNPGTWSGATSYAYEFLKNGVAVGAPSATRTIALAPADLGKSLACRVTGINPVGQAASTTASATVALGAAAVATVKPKILFSAPAANVGETLRSSRGTWSPSATYTYNYIWKRGTTIVKQGATATTYRATLADRGKRLTLTVQAKRTGYATGTATSLAVVVK